MIFFVAQLEAAVEEEMAVYIGEWEEKLAELEDRIALLQVFPLSTFYVYLS